MNRFTKLTLLFCAVAAAASLLPAAGARASNLMTGASVSASGALPEEVNVLYGDVTVSTNKTDYSPGETVVIAGSGWNPGDPVSLHIDESDGDLPWDSVAIPDVAGNFSNAEFVVQSHDIGVLFTLTATQGQSIAIAQFTDVVGAGIAPNGDPGGLEVLGNAVVTAASGHTDWIANGVGTTGLLNSPTGVPIDPTVTFRSLDPFNDTDDIFSGSHTINDNPNTYTWKTASASNKTDLNNVYVHISTDSNGDRWISGSTDRLSTNGTSYVDFELNQAALNKVIDVGCSSAPCGHFETDPAGAVASDPLFATGGRTPNDLLVTAQYNSGGSLATMIVSQWTLVGGTYKWVDITASIPAGTAFVATNTTNGVSVPYGAFGGTTYSQNQFVEMSVNVTSLLKAAVDPCVGIEIKNVFVRSKGSTTATSPIDDFVPPIPVSFNAGFTVSPAQTDVSCNGGSDGTVTVTVTGGVAPYAVSVAGVTKTINASGGSVIFTGLTAGTTSVHVVAANNCTKDTTVDVGQPAVALSASISGQTNSCFGSTTGSATVSPAGGTSPYSFSWNSNPVQTTATASNLGAGTYTVTVADAHGCTTSAQATITQPASALSAQISAQTNVSCFGSATGSATASPSGGTTPYTFSWNTVPVQTTATISNLAAGTYTVTVTDGNGCTATAPATITQPASALSAQISAQTNVSCFGSATGSATASPTGGTTPYSFSWNTVPVQTTAIATNLAAGTYTVTITDANGCTTSAPATITQPAAALSASISGQTNVSCFGSATGSATASPTGGTTPYSFSWNTVPVQTTAIATDLTAGTYTVTVTDANGCTTAAQATITQPASALSAQISAQTNVSCFGSATGSATASPTGGTTPYSFSWNTVPVQTTAIATNLAAGTYTVTITDANGCTTSAPATITQPAAALSASISGQTNVSCFGSATGSATASPTGGTTPYSFSWNTVPVQTTAIATDLTAGTYTVTVTDANGCTTAAQATITQPASALSAQISAQTNVSCFGSATGSATASPTGGTTPYSFSWNTVPVQTTAIATNLAAGTYTVTITDANGCTTSAPATITQPAAALSASISGQTNVSCFGSATGSATASPTGGTTPYSFSWNTVPVQTTAIATNLAAGTYTVTITDANGCTTSAPATITQPAAALSASISGQTNVSCFGSATGSATASPTGGTTPYSFSWNTVPVQTTAIATDLTAGTYTVTVTDANGCTTAAQATITQPEAALSAQTNVTNPSCFTASNGSATAVPSGGTAPYSFSWNTSPVKTTAMISNLGAGTYTVTVTDANGCTATAQAVVNAPPQMNVSLQTGTIALPGGTTTVTLTATGGTGNNIVCLGNNCVAMVNGVAKFTVSAGTYTFTITDANGCGVSVTNVTIPQPSSSNQESQGNGTIPGVNGGSANFNFQVQIPKKGGHHYLTFSDPSTGLSFSSNNCQVTFASPGHMQFTGTAKAKGGKKKATNISFTVDVFDGQPAPDAYTISCSNGYSNGGGLTSGFIVIHLP